MIGGYAHAGVMSGGGSSQVEPAAGPAIAFQPAEARRSIEIHPSAPLAAINAALPKEARVRFNDGYSPAAAAALAADSDVAIVFATQWMAEGVDTPEILPPDLRTSPYLGPPSEDESEDEKPCRRRSTRTSIPTRSS